MIQLQYNKKNNSILKEWQEIFNKHLIRYVDMIRYLDVIDPIILARYVMMIFSYKSKQEYMV